MFLRVSKVKRQNRTYAYVQFVESYRRKEDGLPSHRVVANLGQLSELEIDNLRMAIDASKENRKVVISKMSKEVCAKISKPQSNLAYLDLAVLLEIWNQSGIGRVIRESLPPNTTKVSIDTTIAVLCLHRCQDPGSKLAATRWFKATALPEITGIEVMSFNNSRLHRALYELEQVNETIMAKLPKLYAKCDSDSSALFLDLSDAWFCGSGPSLAQKGLSKDGAIRTKIGIILLCNREGLPLRWDVVAGAGSDSTSMLEMLDNIKGLPWVKGVPLVCDRAMGRSSLIQKMHEMGILFLTALSRHEYSNYAGSILNQPIDFDCEDMAVEEIAEKARAAIEEKTGFIKVRDDLFTIDLGKIEVSVLSERSDLMRHKKYVGNRIRTAMDLGQKIKKLVTDGIFGSVRAAGKSLGLKPYLAHKYLGLTRLPEQVQQAILDGEADNCSINVIDKIATNTEPLEMYERFYDHVKESCRKPARPRRWYNQVNEQHPKSSETELTPDFDVRVVAYFNPQMYADQKMRSSKWLKKIVAFQDDLNRRLCASNCRRSKNSIHAEIDRFMRKKDLISCFDIDIHEDLCENKNRKSVSIKLREKEWKKRGVSDGFSVLVTHADNPQSHQEICKLYRAKDAVEKDFQTIKSVLQLRPIRHRSDEKVKAHVSICMLSLLLERLVKKRLDGDISVQEALETLHSCHLNRYATNTKSLYTITEPDIDQQRILKKLGMSYLASDDYLLERIVSR
jgi:transposase